MKKTDSQEQNPALQQLKILVGDWDMKLSNAAFLPSSSDTITGHVSFEWLEGGAFLVMYMGNKPPNTPDAIWLISRDESTQHYTVLYYDTRKVTAHWEKSGDGSTWEHDFDVTYTKVK
jgi:hypothetical protein